MKGDDTMRISEIILVILLIRIIINQHTIDEHIQESGNRRVGDDELIPFDGLINKIIFRLTVLYKNAIYYLFKKGSK